jgi:chitinase
MKQRQIKYTLLALFALAITSCGGGGTSSSNSTGNGTSQTPTYSSNSTFITSTSQIRTPASAYVTFTDAGNGINAAKLATSTTNDNACFALQPQAANENKNFLTSTQSAEYYSTATISFTVKNICSTPATMVMLPVKLTSVLVNGSPFSDTGWIGQSGTPYLDNVTSTLANNDINLSLNTPVCDTAYCSWAKVAPNATHTLVVNLSLNSTINSLSVADAILGDSVTTPPLPPEPVQTGELDLTVDTTALKTLCASGTTACSIKVNLYKPGMTGTLPQIVVNPTESPVYTVKYTNLLLGNYTMSVDSNSYPDANGGTIGNTYLPSNATVSVNSNQSSTGLVTFNYTAPKPIGNLVINAKGITESTFANIGILTGAAVGNTSKQTYVFNVALNGSYTLNNLPADTYTINLQGMADPLTALYYNAAAKSATVTAGKTTTTDMTFTKVNSTTHGVIFSVTNAPSGQTVAFASQNPGYKYKVTALQNGSYSFLNSESAVALTINTPNGYSVTYDPKVITPSNTTVTVNYTSLTPPPPPLPSGKGRMIGYLMGWNTKFGGIVPAQDLINAGYTHIIVAMGVFSTITPGQIVPVFDNITKSYIDALHQGGIKVLFAVGGASTDRANTSVDYSAVRKQANSDTVFKDTFVSSVNSIVNQYGFDGIDFDVEQGITEKVDLDSMADIINTLRASNPALLITMAPQVANISPQPGVTLGQGNIWGSYTYVIDKTFASLTWVGVQAYNTGSTWGIDGSKNPYDPNADPVDFSVALAGNLLETWNDKFYDGSSTGFPVYVSHLRPDQVVLGYLAPAADGSIDGGGPAANTTNIKKALLCLNTAECSGSRYLKPKAYGLIGGVFNWEVSYDKNNNFKFAKDLKSCAVNGQCQ